MGTYASAGISASVGYEVGTPAYPDPTHDPAHQLNLTLPMLQSITGTTQPSFVGGFLWEIFKQPAPGSGEVTSTQVAQAICSVVLPGEGRCNGAFPSVNTTSLQ